MFAVHYRTNYTPTLLTSHSTELEEWTAILGATLDIPQNQAERIAYALDNWLRGVSSAKELLDTIKSRRLAVHLNVTALEIERLVRGQPTGSTVAFVYSNSASVLPSEHSYVLEEDDPSQQYLDNDGDNDDFTLYDALVDAAFYSYEGA